MQKISLLLLLVSKCLCQNYFLKWVTDETKYPIIFNHKIDFPNLYGWYKYSNQEYIENLQSNAYNMKINEANGTNTLKINTYDLKTNDQLDHYKLQLKTPKDIDYLDDPVSDSTDEFIYSLGYVKNFRIEVHEEKDYINSTCFLNVIIPLGISDEHMDFLKDQIQENVDLVSNFHDDEYYDDIEKTSNRNIVVVRKRRSSFDRYVMEVQYNSPSIIVYGINKDNDLYENVTCHLLLIDYDGSIYKKTIFKMLKAANSSSGLKLFSVLGFILVNFIGFIIKTFT
jgi:hypothetical protein